VEGGKKIRRKGRTDLQPCKMSNATSGPFCCSSCGYNLSSNAARLFLIRECNKSFRTALLADRTCFVTTSSLYAI
jgi:hypothetical protein